VEKIDVPTYLREIVEQVAFSAREDKKVDKRSGVSQRLPIATMELILSNAERRALLHGERIVLPRVGDLYAALPGIAGKIELEYEGEMRGAEVVIRELIRTAIGKVFEKYFANTNTQQIEQWFNLGGTVKIDDDQPSTAAFSELKQIQGLFDKLAPVAKSPSSPPESLVAAAEFLLEGMYAHNRLSRSEERGFQAPERTQRRQERAERDPDYDDLREQRRSRRGFN
jgi:magnesium chelatase subunit I